MSTESNTPSALLGLFAVPEACLGQAPQPRSAYERGEHLRIMAVHAGIDPLALGNADVDYAIVLNMRQQHGL